MRGWFYLKGDCIADAKLEKQPLIGQSVILYHAGESKTFEIEELYEVTNGFSIVLKEKTS